MRSRLYSAVVLMLLAVTDPLSCAESIELQLRIPASGRIGDALPSAVTFTNMGDETVYVEFGGADYGAESLVVCAESETGNWYRIGQVHLDRDVAVHRFDFVPLGMGQRFESPILAINDPQAGELPVLRLSEVGTYRLFARFESRGMQQEGVIWPIWRGVIKSSPQQLVLTAPKDEDIRTAIENLRACVLDDSECDIGDAGYFTVVRDHAAAVLLSQLLDKTETPDLLLANASANQRDDKADAALRRFAIRFPRYGDIVEDLLHRRTEDASVCMK